MELKGVDAALAWIQKEIVRALRYSEPFCIVLFSCQQIDSDKIQQLGAELAARSRGADVVFLLDNAVFVALPKTALDGAVLFGKRMVEELNSMFEKLFCVVCYWACSENKAEILLRRALQALDLAVETKSQSVILCDELPLDKLS